MAEAILVLEDGSIFTGQALGATGRTSGEVVFNTSMTGYQEVLTDPSYAGQIVTMTYPLQGNYGVNPEDQESWKPTVRGFIVKESCSAPSNFRSTNTLNNYLVQHGVIGLEGIDTRALTKKLRQEGTLKGILSSLAADVNHPQRLVEEARSLFAPEPELVSSVSATKPYILGSEGPLLAVLDLGVKQSILDHLRRQGFQLVVLPWDTSADEIMAYKPKGVFLTNGPGDPAVLEPVIDTARDLAGKLPLAGICLGHQILGLALGGQTYKLKFGHRGANHPVKDLATRRVYITSQNHGYALSPDLPQDLAVTHVNLNDDSVEGFKSLTLPVMGIQYHPEASPGPWDSLYLFEDFLKLIAYH